MTEVLNAAKNGVPISVAGLCYAPIIQDDSTGVQYGQTIHLPGTATVAITNNSEIANFYADGKAYEALPNGVGDMDIAVTHAGAEPEYLAYLLGHTYTSANGQVIEGADDVAPYVALGFYRDLIVEGVLQRVCTWFLKARAYKGDPTYNTKTNTVEGQPQPLNFRAINRTYDNNYKNWFSTANKDCPNGVTATTIIDEDSGFFTDPDYIPAPTGVQISDLAAASGAASGQIDLTFSAPTNATSVKAQVQDAGIGIWVDATTSAPITAASTSAVITGLTGGNEYNVRLIVTGGDKAGTSNTDSATALA